MKLQICAEIEGQFLLRSMIEVKWHSYEFSIFSKDEKFYISVTKPVKEYMNYAPKMYSRNNMLHIEATPPEIYKDLEDWLIYIEAMGAFNFGVSKVHVDELEVKWIYEKEEEKGTIPITSLKRNKQKRKTNKYVTYSNLLNLVVFRKMLPDAYIPFAYYRQAKVFFEENNYYFAFINYFMMLEFCFANGQFHKKGMTCNFQKSNLLRLCILSTINLIKANESYKWLVAECKSRHKNVDVEGVIYILIEYRGLLSHASERSKKYLFDDLTLRPLALIISMICFSLCGYIQIYSCSSEENKNRMIQDRINKLEKEI